MKKLTTTLLAVLAWMFLLPVSKIDAQTCTADVTGTQRLSELTWTASDGANCPPVSPYTGNVTINGPGNGDTLIIDVNFELTGVLTVNGLGNPVVRINEGITMTVNGTIVCLHPNSTIDIHGVLNVNGTIELKNNCYFCGPGVANIEDISIKNNGSCDGIVVIYAYTCTAKNNDFCTDCIVGPLAVDMLGFTATSMDEGILLTWEVSDQGENAFYTIERGNGSNFWTRIGDIDNIYDQRFYSFFDPLPFKGNNYYRLSQTDIDGTQGMLGLVSVMYEVSENIKIWSSGTYLFIQSYEDLGPHTVRVHDMNGILHATKNINTGNGTEVTINLGLLTPGSYAVQVMHKNGTVTEQIIVTNDF